MTTRGGRYSINYMITGYAPQGLLPAKMTKIKYPSQKILYVDESAITIDDGAWAPDHYFSDGKNMLSDRHDKKSEKQTDPNYGRGNAAFCDGHADYIERKLSFDKRYYDPLAQ